MKSAWPDIVVVHLRGFGFAIWVGRVVGMFARVLTSMNE